jgi:peptidoglycan/LPS O-acetylase OafA/YrhL
MFIPEIDGLRFIAIFWVLAFHINGEYIKVMGRNFPGQIDNSLYTHVLHTWDFGVQLFFVISGFILSLPFVRHYWGDAPKPRLGSYYLRRITRIEPPYVINLLLFTLLLLAVKGPPIIQLLPHLVASLCYSHNLVYQSVSTINFVTWSLEIEAQFYIAAPLLAFLFFNRSLRFRRVRLASIILASATLAWWLNNQFQVVHMTLLGQLPYFLAGFLLAAWYSELPSTATPRTYRWDAFGALAWFVILVLLMNKSFLSALVLPFLVIIAYLSVFNGKILGFVLTRPSITTIGGMCYTIYLYHPFLKSGLKHLLFPLRVSHLYWVNSVFQIFALGSAIILVAAVCFLLFEKPFMFRDWPTRLRSCLKNLVPQLASRQATDFMPIRKPGAQE